MSGFYNDLTVEEQGRVLAAMAGLKLNASQGKPVTRLDVNAAFMQATGKSLSIEYMRDPAVVQLMGLVSPSRGATGAFSSNRQAQNRQDPSTAITDRNLAARGLPVPSRPSAPLPGTTRYSAGSGSVSNARFGR